MATTLAISRHCNSLAEVRARFGVTPTTDESFFPEWHQNLPALTNSEKERCDRIKQQYLYHRDNGHIGEGLVNQIVIAPLLDMAKFYDPPFDIQSEYPVQIEAIKMAGDEEIIYRGRIDTFVIHKKLWVLVIESKGTSFNIEEGMAQALIYMLSNKAQPTYGFISNGGFSIFVKSTKDAQYIFSDEFSLYRRHNELYGVLGAMKNIAQSFQ
jgi:hypothetical protein